MRDGDRREPYSKPSQTLEVLLIDIYFFTPEIHIFLFSGLFICFRNNSREMIPPSFLLPETWKVLAKLESKLSFCNNIFFLPHSQIEVYGSLTDTFLETPNRST